MKKKRIFVKSPEYVKNEIRFKLLVTLPAFQKDVEVVRAELELPVGGLPYGEELQKWNEEKLFKKSDQISNSKVYVDMIRKASELRWKNHSEYLRIKWEAEDLIPVNKLKNRLVMLGEKYKLPANFYDRNPFYGLYPYLLTGKISAPSNNWAILTNPEARKGTAKTVSIVTYAPISKKELKDAMGMLVSTQKYNFPKQLTVSNRIKKQFDRDIEIYQELVLERKKKPVKTKVYEDDGYLSRLIKAGGVSDKKLRSLEKEHSHSVHISFDETTSKEVAKRLRITPDAVRKSIERIKKQINILFPSDTEGQEE